MHARLDVYRKLAFYVHILVDMQRLQPLPAPLPKVCRRKIAGTRPTAVITSPPMFRHPLLALVVVLASLLASFAHAQSPADVLIRHATIVDVEHARLIADQAIVTSGNTILAVGPDAEIAQAWRAYMEIGRASCRERV